MNKINKSIILLATAVSFHAPTSFAASEQFYVKANTGYARMLDLKIEDGDQSIKFKSKNGSGTFGIGVGYYIMDKFRVDLVYDYFLDSMHKHSFSDEDGDFVRNKIKGSTSALTFNGYVDLFDAGNMRLFAGAGLGIAQTKAKGISSSRMNLVDDPDILIKFKTTNNFTYSIHLGASLEVAENLHTDLAYSWRDFGKVKGKEEQKGGVIKYKGHHLTLGIRYDI